MLLACVEKTDHVTCVVTLATCGLEVPLQTGVFFAQLGQVRCQPGDVGFGTRQLFGHRVKFGRFGLRAHQLRTQLVLIITTDNSKKASAGGEHRWTGTLLVSGRSAAQHCTQVKESDDRRTDG